MKLYEIDQEINDLLNGAEVDPETGEIIDISEQLALLQNEKDVKIHNIGLYIKNLLAESEAVKNEKDNLAKREKSLKNQAEYLKNYLAQYVGTGKKLSYPNLAISWRKSSQVITKDDPEKTFLEHPEYVKEKTLYSFDKIKIKEDLKAGKELDFAYIQENNNIQIK